MTDEIDDVQPQDATAEPDVPSGVVRLGIEARAEYIRARKRLGLSDDAAERLGTVARYRLEAELGRGGMGVVYRASDPELGRSVAIKLVQAVPFVRYDRLRGRLLREAKVLAKLTHPNVVRVYDCGQHEGEVYLAMEYVEGTTLREWQRNRSRSSILDAYRQAARGLAAAHDMAIVHRDFKPDNVLVANESRVLVGDFGLAGVPARDELSTEGSPTNAPTGERVSTTRTGALLGTLAYMAPEQLRGEVATPRSDQFAFCVSLWEALTGVRPFEGEQPDALLEQIEQGRLQGAERLPRRLRARLLRGLATDPKARFDDLSELADGLLPRRGPVVLGIGVSLSLVVGLAIGSWLFEQAHRPCEELHARIDYVDEMPQWSRVQGTLDDPKLRPTYASLRRQPKNMLEETEDLCRLGADDQRVARRQWLEMRVAFLRSTLESLAADDPEDLQRAAEYLEGERWTASPPRPLEPELEELLKDSYSARMNNDLENALALAEAAVDVAGDRDLELALAHRWRGRVLAFMGGRHEDAMDAYQHAVSHADAASYDSLRLETELLAAKSAVMRGGDPGRARDSLRRAEGLFHRLGEPWLSPRRADYHEVLAAVLKRDRAYDTALAHQKFALLMRGWRGEVLKIGMAYLNLGTIHELRNRSSDPELARLNYERALETLGPVSSSPEWLQAAFGLGRWLVQNAQEDWPYATRLLEEVRARSSDLKLSALTDLVLLALHQKDAARVRYLVPELEALLNEDSTLSAERSLDAWQNVAIGYATADDLAAFERARSAFERVAQEALDNGSPLTGDGVEQQRAQLDLSAASELAEVAPDRASDLARSVRDHLLRRLEAEQMPEAERRQLLDMLAAAEELLL